MKTLFITPGPIKWASSRFRAHWVAEHMEDAEVVELSKAGDLYIDQYDATIWIKTANLNAMTALSNMGKQVWWDLCDPVHWFSPEDAKAIMSVVTGIVCSNQELANDFEEWSGIHPHTIPDRLNLDHYPKQAKHEDHEPPIKFIWFGAGQNRFSIFAALANLDRLAANGHRITLTICDDRPQDKWQFTNSYPVIYAPWSLEHENGMLSVHDIALLPTYPGPWGRVKSNNKTLTAWACGLPVTDGEYYDELEELVESAEKRRKHVEGFNNVIRDAYSVEKSAREWERLLGDDLS